jgi:hypothetical protein
LKIERKNRAAIGELIEILNIKKKFAIVRSIFVSAREKSTVKVVIHKTRIDLIKLNIL